MGRHNRAGTWGARDNSGRRLDRRPACRGRRYDTREAAEAALRTFRGDTSPVTGQKKIPIGVQECEVCGQFYLTTSTSKPAPAGRLRRRRKGGMGWT